MKKTYLVIIISIAAILIVLGSGLLWLYNGPASNTEVSIIRALHLPVARVGSNFISGRELFDRYAIASELYKAEKDFTPATSQKDILDRLIQIKELEIIAAKYNISVSNKQIDAEYNRIANQSGGADALARSLQDEYHMSPEQFKETAIKPDVLKVALAINFYTNKSLNAALYKNLEAVQTKTKQGTDFAELAKTYSEDPTSREFGGDSGEIPFKDLAAEFQDALSKTEVGEIKTVTTRFGVYFVKMISRKDTADGPSSLHFQIIYFDHGTVTAKKTESAFSEWYNKQVSELKVLKFIKF